MNITIFDLDHTLLKRNSSYFFGFYLYHQRFISSIKLIAALADYVRHKYFGLSIHKLHEKSFDRLFKGRSLPLIEQHVKTFLDQQLNQLISPIVLDRLKKAQRSGDTILILSSSPDFLVSAIAERFSIDQWHATRYLTDEKKQFTSIGNILDGEGKIQIVHELIKKHEWHVDKITVFSDSHLDLPILEMAHHSVGVNPDPILRKICLAKGWEILETAEAACHD
jgi:HAD superfamily hydrolase (TIGR01490 family)